MSENGKVPDISEFDVTTASEEGVLLELRNPKNGEVLRFDDGRPFTIKLVGKDSERFLKLVRQQGDRRIAGTMRTRQPATIATMEKDDTELLVNATLGWDILMDGQKPPESTAKYREVYTKYRWIREQVDEFVGNRANFFRA